NQFNNKLEYPLGGRIEVVKLIRTCVGVNLMDHDLLTLNQRQGHAANTQGVLRATLLAIHHAH
ncbi:MAG: hypothetical protein N0E54_17625, partial [Candidatus Thiodiazotropha taylori]|nr:hypothetical protein [Candidatus Thiodiazotropha endolucinida]MCW4230565.1 hypothetical protein [Candidatus Thiodiazotropha taylori]